MSSFFSIGPVMLDIVGLTLTDHEKDVINHPNVGAVILFSRNYQDPDQIYDLIRQIRSTRKGDILIAVDQEGGRVQRFQNGFTRLPPCAAYAQFPELAESSGWLMAAELLAVGVDFSFAPVLDVDCGVSEIIGDRSFSSDADMVIRLASDFMRGMNLAGMAATGKHFPGHGAVALDSHLTLPVDNRLLTSLLNKDLLPFKRLINEGLQGIMPAHVLYPKIDGNAAGFSQFWIQKILREEFKFTGTVFSDDLSMEGAATVGDFPQRALLAQHAGCDMILVCNNPLAAEKVLETLPITHDPIRAQRFANMQAKKTFDREQLMQSEQWRRCSNDITKLIEHYA